MLTLTSQAQDKVSDLLSASGRDDLRLRLSVQPGGCSGLIHEMFFDQRELEGDHLIEFDEFEVVIDKMSAPYLEGSTIDFVDRIDQQGFTLDNPNAQSTCACGSSFA